MFIGVPWKGRNFRKAAAKAFEETFYDPGFLADQFNGKSKKEAKSKSIGPEFLDEVKKPGWREIGKFQDTDRKSDRYGFDQIYTRKGVVSGYSGDPFDSGFDEVYAPDDHTINELLDGAVDLEAYESGSVEQKYLGENSYDNRGKINLGRILEEKVEDYEMCETVDTGVSLAAMVSEDLEQESSVDTVLVSSELENVSKSVAEYTWTDIDIKTFQEYAEKNQLSYEDEEELIGIEPEVAGVYIVDSGKTADENNLEYERTADSYLRRWTAKPENQFKELETTMT